MCDSWNKQPYIHCIIYKLHLHRRKMYLNIHKYKAIDLVSRDVGIVLNWCLYCKYNLIYLFSIYHTSE